MELDCWDGDDGMPVIYHGHTLTTKIPFKVGTPFSLSLSLSRNFEVKTNIFCSFTYSHAQADVSTVHMTHLDKSSP